MKTFERVFVNPLLAWAWIDGCNFVNDDGVRCSKPKKTGPHEWVVTIEDDDSDEGVVEDDEEKPIPGYVPIKVVTIGPEERPETFDDFKKELDLSPVDMKKLSIDRFNIEMSSCGKCVPCKMGQDCMLIIQAACKDTNFMLPMRGER